MYLSGTISTFPSRQHQLISGADTYNSFISEFGSYSGIMTPQWTAQRQREFGVMRTRYGISGTPSNYPIAWLGGDAIQSLTPTIAVFTDDADAIDGRVYSSFIPSGEKLHTDVLTQSVGGAMNWGLIYQPRTVGTPITLLPFSWTDNEGRHTIDMTTPYEGYLILDCSSETIEQMITVTAYLDNL